MAAFRAEAAAGAGRAAWTQREGALRRERLCTLTRWWVMRVCLRNVQIVIVILRSAQTKAGSLNAWRAWRAMVGSLAFAAGWGDHLTCP